MKSHDFKAKKLSNLENYPLILSSTKVTTYSAQITKIPSSNPKSVTISLFAHSNDTFV